MHIVAPHNFTGFSLLRTALHSPISRSLHTRSNALFMSISPPRLPTSQSRRFFQRPLNPSSQQTRRTIFTESLPTVLVPPAVFLCCFTGLWSYKIIMTIVFQNKLIYMPYMPPFARSEKIEEYTAACKPVVWEEQRIKSVDGTRISLCVGNIPPSDALKATPRHVVIIYFQGCVRLIVYEPGSGICFAHRELKQSSGWDRT